MSEYSGLVIYDLRNIYLFFLLLVSSFIDYKYQRIPNYLTLPSMVAGLIYYAVISGLSGFFFSLAGLLTGFFLLLIPYAMGGMGAGDVKLLAAVGAILGSRGVFEAFLITALAGGLYALAMILYHRDIFKGFFKSFFNTIFASVLTKTHIPQRVVEHENKPRLCYGIAIAIGTYLYVGIKLSGHDFIF